MYTEDNLLEGTWLLNQSLGRFGTNMHDDKTFAKNMIFTKKRALEHSSPAQLYSDYNMTIEPCDLMSPMYQTDHDAMMSI